MDPNQHTSGALIDRASADIAQLLRRFENILAFESDEKGNRNNTAVGVFQMEVETAALCLVPKLFHLRLQFNVQASDKVVFPDPRCRGYPLPDADSQGSVAVWEVADRGSQRGRDQSGDRGRECGGRIAKVAGPW
ncbi:hypothetical protein BDR22DRAFT_870492 [Usnea florida]